MNAYNDRMFEVHELQRALNMEPRSDSKLTILYAENNTNMTAKEVAHELMSVDYIYKYTLYGELLEEYMRILAKKVKTQYKLSWSDTWEVVRFYAPTALKLQCLMACQTRIPEKMPCNV